MVCIAAVNPVWGGREADLIDRTFGNLVGKCRMEKEREREKRPIQSMWRREKTGWVGQCNVIFL